MMNMRFFSIFSWALLLLFAGCGGRVVYLDGDRIDAGSTNSNSSPDAIAPGVAIVVEDQETAIRIAVDETRVYWLADLPNGWSEGTPPRYARIRSCVKTDCRATITTYDSITHDRSPVGGPPLRYAALAVGGDNVYWAQFKGGLLLTILTCPSVGCVGAPRVLASNVDVVSMAVDDTHIYWTSEKDTAIYRLALAGSATPEAIAINEPSPSGIAVNGTHVYWISNARQPSSSIKRLRKEGGEQAVAVATEQNQLSSLSLDDEFFYWANTFLDGSISRCPLSGCAGPPTMLVAKQSQPLVPLADGKNLFWMNIVDAAIAPFGPRAAVMRCPIDACASATETMAVQAFSPDGMSMAMDRSDVYWVAQGTAEPMMWDYYPHATIYRRAK